MADDVGLAQRLQKWADGKATLKDVRGYTDEDVLKIAGRNHLRAMRRMEAVAAELHRTETPLITEPKSPA